ncbi:MAG TPA: EamA family transporter [Pyrinomonadaceae bacterium]
MTSTRPSRALIILAFAAVYIIWGSTYLGIRLAIQTLPPFLMAAMRFLIAGGILFIVSIFNGARFHQSFANWRRALLIGALLLLCGNGGVTWAEKYVASSLAALLVATEPLWVVIFNWALSHRRPNARVLLGIFVGLAGVALLVSDGLGQSEKTGLISAGVVLLSSLAWASGSVYSNRNPIDAPTSMASGMQMLAGGGWLFILALVTGDVKRLNLEHASWTSIGAFAYLTIFGSLVVFTAYSWLLKNVTPARAATYAYVNPVVAVLLGWSIAAEPLTSKMILAAAIIVGSVVLITIYGREHAGADAVHDSECPTPPCA